MKNINRRDMSRDVSNNKKERVRFYYIFKSYGLTKDDYYALMASQDNRCGICRAVLDESKVHGVHVDHCHVTNVVRGMLCGECNKMLGRVEHKLEDMRRFWEYLDKNPRISIPDYEPRRSGRPSLNRTPEEQREFDRIRKAQKRKEAKAQRPRDTTPSV